MKLSLNSSFEEHDDDQVESSLHAKKHLAVGHPEVLQ